MTTGKCLRPRPNGECSCGRVNAVVVQRTSLYRCFWSPAWNPSAASCNNTLFYVERHKTNSLGREGRTDLFAARGSRWLALQPLGCEPSRPSDVSGSLGNGETLSSPQREELSDEAFGLGERGDMELGSSLQHLLPGRVRSHLGASMHYLLTNTKP